MLKKVMPTLLDSNLIWLLEISIDAFKQMHLGNVYINITDCMLYIFIFIEKYINTLFDAFDKED